MQAASPPLICLLPPACSLPPRSFLMCAAVAPSLPHGSHAGHRGAWVQAPPCTYTFPEPQTNSAGSWPGAVSSPQGCPSSRLAGPRVGGFRRLPAPMVQPRARSSIYGGDTPPSQGGREDAGGAHSASTVGVSP